MTIIRNRFTAHSLPHCLALAMLLLLNACASPTKPTTTAVATTAADSAALGAASNDSPEAAKLLLQQAAQAPSPQREALQLRAAEALIRGQRAEEAAQILEKLPPAGSADYQTRQAIAQARVLLHRQQPQAALQRLASASDNIPPERQVDFHHARIDAYNATGNHLESARERVWMEGLLDSAELAKNHQAIWDTLSQLPDTVLANMRTTPPPDVFSGWLELVETTRALRDTPSQLEIALTLWRANYPGHPAIPDFLNALQGHSSQDIKPQAEQQIAVLLPLSGPLAEAGQALRDGMLAAHFQNTSARSQGLRFYDTGPSSDRVWSLYQRAISEGAQQVIGPLSKEAVAALTEGGELTVPVLALNNLPENKPTPALLYQFALAPEDEAEQIAVRAWQDGHRRALLLSPASAWGQRVQQAFTQHWQSLGGTLLDARTYGSDQSGYSDLVRDILKLDASEQRRQDLTRLLGQKLEFIPHPRQDADFVVLLGNADQARLLHPLFAYHHAEQLPVYATSQVYSGVTASQQDRDLNGLRFCDMPWMLPSGHPSAVLRGEIARLWPAAAERYARLYALGIDALQIMPDLQGLQDGSFARHPGVTGDLYLDKARRVHRELQWAQFQDGQPVALPDVAAALTNPQEITDDSPANTPPAWGTR